jgi:hypothetical protein
MIPANDKYPPYDFDWSLLWALPASVIAWVVLVRESVRIWLLEAANRGAIPLAR